MTAYVALLRGINLMGGTTLRMSELKQLGENLGLQSVRTFIASGNLLFTTGKGEAVVKSALQAAIGDHMSRDVGVMVRTAAEMEAVVAANPFAEEPSNKCVAIFLDCGAGKDALETARKADGEQMALGVREIYVHYPHGQGASRLVIPAAAKGTARNMNTVAKLAEPAREMQ